MNARRCSCWKPGTVAKSLVIVSTLVVSIPTGCARPVPANAATVINHLDAAASTLARLEKQDAELWQPLVEVVLNIAQQRLETTLALEIDALIDPSGRPIDEALDRLTTPGESAVLAREIRAGRMTTDQAIAMLSDFGYARALSPDARRSVERQIIARLLPVVEFESRKASILNATARQTALRVALVQEIRESIDLLARAMDAPPAALSPPSDALRLAVDQVVQDEPLAQSLNTLIDTLLTNDKTRGEDQ